MQHALVHGVAQNLACPGHKQTRPEINITEKKLQKPKKEKEKTFNPWKPIVAKAKAVVPERKREIRSRARERMQLRS
jgi:hypothetical protein